MIRWLNIFRQRFSNFEGSLVLIGGAACDDWFTRQGLSFRATKDRYIVLLLEAVNPDFIAAMRQFIADGGYEIRQRSEDGILSATATALIPLKAKAWLDLSKRQNKGKRSILRTSTNTGLTSSA